MTVVPQWMTLLKRGEKARGRGTLALACPRAMAEKAKRFQRLALLLVIGATTQHGAFPLRPVFWTRPAPLL